MVDADRPADQLPGGPTAAPVFAFLMGASLGAAPRTSFATMAMRGLWLVFLGYVLNLFRGVIPASIGMASGFVTQEQIQPFTPWWLLTTVDLHHMVGLSLVLIAALRAWAGPGWVWIAIAAVVALDRPVAPDRHRSGSRSSMRR